MKEFSDMTKDRWEDVFETDIFTFFNVIAFCRKWADYKKEQEEKWKARN